MSKPLINFTAMTKNGDRVDLEYTSIEEAAFFNPGLKNFRADSFVKNLHKKI